MKISNRLKSISFTVSLSVYKASNNVIASAIVIALISSDDSFINLNCLIYYYNIIKRLKLRSSSYISTNN